MLLERSKQETTDNKIMFYLNFFEKIMSDYLENHTKISSHIFLRNLFLQIMTISCSYLFVKFITKQNKQETYIFVHMFFVKTFL